VTISNAVDDDVDRIVATTTVDGERTAITYDLD
jgi:YD repeat-containing protein